MRQLCAMFAVAGLVSVAAMPAHAAPPALTATVQPPRPLFGDPFSYVVRARVAADAAAGARIVADVAPFVRIGPTRTTRSVADGVATVTVTETLACLTAACLPTRSGSAITLPAATLAVDGLRAKATPVELTVGTRVAPAEIKAAKPAFRRPSGLPPLTTDVSPLGAAAVFALLGLGLVAAGALVLLAPLRRRRQGVRATAPVDSLARAARLLRESAVREPSDRRRAAALAARVAQDDELATEAETVAWSRPEPAPPDAITLADRLERKGGVRA